MLADIAATPDFGTLCLRSGGIYKVNGQIHLVARNGLTIDGNGATLRQTIEVNAAMFLFDHGGNDLNVRNLIIDGGNTQPNTYRAGLEYGHGIQLGGVVRASIRGVTFNNVLGDAVYMSGGTAGTTFRESQGITIVGNAVNGTGRMGMSITDGAGSVTIQANSFARIPLYAFDIEPNGHIFNGIVVGGHDVLFSGNTYYPGPISHMVSLGGNGEIRNVTISQNHSVNGTIRTSVGGLGPRPQNITITANLGDLSGSDYPIELRNSDTITITNNRQPLRAGQLFVSQTGCTGVMISGN